MSYAQISGTKSYVLNFQIVTCYWSGNSRLPIKYKNIEKVLAIPFYAGYREHFSYKNVLGLVS